MKKNNECPKTLKDHIFYGLTLDDEQRKFVEAIWSEDTIITVCNAKAGTGKTTLAIAVANLLYEYGRYNGVSYIISPSMEEKQGYLPGNNYDKTAPYIQPLKDALLTLDINPDYAIKDPNNVSIIKENKAFIDFMPHTYLRGTNFENQVVIIDEAQNFYFDELKKTLTRIHDNCKVILIGHTEQCDLYKKPQNTGFRPYWNAFANCDDSRVKVCELTINHRGWLSTFCDDVAINNNQSVWNWSDKGKNTYGGNTYGGSSDFESIIQECEHKVISNKPGFFINSGCPEPGTIPV